MPVRMSLWKVDGEALVPVMNSMLDMEERLENWIAKDNSLMGIDVLVIGRQVVTSFGGRIDLLGIDQDGNIVVIELKRDKTPRDIVAQVLDYASWVNNLSGKEIDAIAKEYLKAPLQEKFEEHFKKALPDTINNDHRMIIVASEFDDSTERIIQYLSNEYGVSINGVFFSFFQNGQQQLLGRSWLIDPENVSERADARVKLPWSGYYFVNVGEGEHRNWDDCLKYGFISAGQGERASSKLKRLKPGDKIFAYMKDLGYVGYGEVTRESVMVREFSLADSEKKLLELPLIAPHMKANSESPELSEWVVGVKWLKTYPRNEAKWFKGGFANQNIVCQLRDTETVAFLKKNFQIE